MSALLAILAIAIAGCGRGSGRERVQHLTIATGGPGGVFYPLASALSQAYADQLPSLATRLMIGGSSASVEAVHKGTAQIGFTQADIAYIAYSRGPHRGARPYTDLRAVALLWSNTAQLVVPRNSSIRSVEDLRGRRVAVGTVGSGTEGLARIILTAYGLSYQDIRPAFLSFRDTIAKIRSGEVDAAFAVAGIPTPAVLELNQRPGVRLVPIESGRINAVRAEYPFLRPIVLARGTYKGQTADVPAVGVDDVLICRSDLDADYVYLLTKWFFDALPRLARDIPAAGEIEIDRAPATPIPLHPGAARYYREREIGR